METGQVGPWTRLIFLCFFSSHILITLFLDSQALFGRSLHPPFLLDLYDWYASTFNDVLMARSSTPDWMRCMVAMEVAFQLPFFFVAVRAFWRRDNGVRRGAGPYGAHVATTMCPILYVIATDERLERGERLWLGGFYLPYLVLPLWLMVMAVREERFWGEGEDRKIR